MREDSGSYMVHVSSKVSARRSGFGGSSGHPGSNRWIFNTNMVTPKENTIIPLGADSLSGYHVSINNYFETVNKVSEYFRGKNIMNQAQV